MSLSQLFSFSGSHYLCAQLTALRLWPKDAVQLGFSLELLSNRSRIALSLYQLDLCLTLLIERRCMGGEKQKQRMIKTEQYNGYLCGWGTIQLGSNSQGLLRQGSLIQGHGLVAVCGLLGPGLHSRRWVVGETETAPPPPRNQVHGKIIFRKTGPWCQKCWDHWSKVLAFLNIK